MCIDQAHRAHKPSHVAGQGVDCRTSLPRDYIEKPSQHSRALEHQYQSIYERQESMKSSDGVDIVSSWHTHQ